MECRDDDAYSFTYICICIHTSIFLILVDQMSSYTNNVVDDVDFQSRR